MLHGAVGVGVGVGVAVVGAVLVLVCAVLGAALVESEELVSRVDSASMSRVWLTKMLSARLTGAAFAAWREENMASTNVIKTVARMFDGVGASKRRWRQCVTTCVECFRAVEAQLKRLKN